MSIYAKDIKEELAKLKVEGLDLAHVESTMRNEHRTLDHLSRRAFAGVVRRAVADLRHPEHVCDHCWRSQPEFRFISGSIVVLKTDAAEVGVVEEFEGARVSVRWDSGLVTWIEHDKLNGPLTEAQTRNYRSDAKKAIAAVESEVAAEYEHLEPKKSGFHRRVVEELATLHANACIEDLVDKGLFDKYDNVAMAEFAKAFSIAVENRVSHKGEPISSWVETDKGWKADRGAKKKSQKAKS